MVARASGQLPGLLGVSISQTQDCLLPENGQGSDELNNAERGSNFVGIQRGEGELRKGDREVLARERREEQGGPASEEVTDITHSHTRMERPWEIREQEVGTSDNLIRKEHRHPLGGQRGAGMKPSHQRGSPGARLWGRCCGVHVAEQSLNLPQGDTPASVTHLGKMGHVRGSADLFSTPHTP